MKTKHTPGPWIDQVASITTIDFKKEIATVNIKFGNKEHEANAKLIAAAPDLLERLNNLQSTYGHLFSNEDVYLNKEAIKKAEL